MGGWSMIYWFSKYEAGWWGRLFMNKQSINFWGWYAVAMKEKFVPEKIEWWQLPLLCLLLIGVVSSLSVSSWLVAFLFMDFVTIIFLVMLSVEGASSKYGPGIISFVVHQSIASAILYFSYFLYFWTSIYYDYVNLITMVGLFWKSALPPFHGWYASIFGEVSWSSVFLLSTVLKVPPTMLIGSIIIYSSWSYLWWGLCVYAMFFSSMAAAGQLSMRGFFAYSSMGNTCWMVLASVISVEIYCFFFVIYAGTLLLLMMICKKWDVKKIVNLSNMSKEDGWLIACSSLSLAGVPPFAGFMPKLFICCSAVFSGSSVMVLVVIGYLVASVIGAAIYVDVASAAICARLFMFICPMVFPELLVVNPRVAMVFFLSQIAVAVGGMMAEITHFYF
nr:NADH dehydrogenase subunit 2 [Tegillarca granosa]